MKLNYDEPLTNVAFKFNLRPNNEGSIVSASFVGLLDETAVWNRALSATEVDHSLFKMPQGIAAREMRADHGVQLDVTLGQVHYGRFNNPCKEGPVHDVSGSPAHDAEVRRCRLNQSNPC